jgi:hypothetical protein
MINVSPVRVQCSVGALGLGNLMLDLGFVVYLKFFGNKIYLSKRKAKKLNCRCSLYIFTCLS